MDKKVTLELHPNRKGNARGPLERLVRQILHVQKTAGIKQWQCIAMKHNGSYEGFSPNGKGYISQESKANEYNGALAAHLRYYCLGKGATPDLVNRLLAKTFSNQACCETGNVKFMDGKVVTASQASFHANLKRMETGWLDITKGMSRLRHEEYTTKQ